MRIFISGVHGVGKSFLCDQFIKLNNNFIHISSSELISSVRKKSWDDNKIVLTPEENQSALLQELETYNNKNILLDGHFCLIGKTMKLYN
ncbi:TPA: AAA family ATPase [Proteus mirabilis]